MASNDNFVKVLQILKEAKYPYSKNALPLLTFTEIIEHHKLFIFSVIGADLKIQLKDFTDRTCNVGRKEILVLQRMRKYFDSKHVTEMLFDDVIEANFNSKRHRLSMEVVLKNSDIVELFKRENKTYIRFTEVYKVDMFDKEIRKLITTNKLEELTCQCLYHFLKNFESPINTGELRNLFPVVLKKSFFKRYNHIFVLVGCHVSAQKAASNYFDKNELSTVENVRDTILTNSDLMEPKDNKIHERSNENVCTSNEHQEECFVNTSNGCGHHEKVDLLDEECTLDWFQCIKLAKITRKSYMQRVEKLNLADEFSDSEVFLVDGDGLLVSVLNDENLNQNFGGITLHLIYLIERKLDKFVRKGGKFRVVFFKQSGLLLSHGNVSYMLARNVLIPHLKFCTLYPVLDMFDSPWDCLFKEYIDKHIPSFMLISDEGFNMIPSQRNKLSYIVSQFLFQWYILQILTLQLNVAYIQCITVGVSTLDGFHITATRRYKITEDLDRTFQTIVRFAKQDILHAVNIDFNYLFLQCKNLLSGYKDIGIECYSVYLFIKRYLHKDDYLMYEEFAKFCLFYVLLKRKFPLKLRSHVQIKDDKQFQKQINCFHFAIIDVVTHLSRDFSQNVDFNHVSDVWDGNLFMKVSLSILEIFSENKESDLFEDDIMFTYKTIMMGFFQLLQITRNIMPQKDSVFINTLKKLETVPVVGYERAIKADEIIPIDSDLVKGYASDIYNTMNVLDKNDHRIKELVPNQKEFEDRYHWHCNKLIFEDFIWAKKEKEKGKSFRKYEQKKAALMPRYIQYYGESMSETGSAVIYPPIVVSNEIENKPNSSDSKIKSRGSKKVVPRKADIIIANNKAEKKKKQLEKDRESWAAASAEIHKLKRCRSTDAYLKCMDLIEKLEPSVCNMEILMKMYLQAISIYKKIYIICKEGNKNAVAIKIFLTIRKVFQNAKEYMSKCIKKKLESSLKLLNFYKLSKLLGLPCDSDVTGECHVAFQLRCIGHLLQRDVRTDPDERVKHFIPDTWQRELFDCIDKKQSVLVVAPTSSGKTYASYYCMQKILEQNNDDVVVYISPSKALVNQVSAVITTRFGNKQMPAGKTVCGMFTRDYRNNVNNCQILVTVPQCFEILLLSADSFAWSQKVKYVIFDEIHCIGSEFGAEVWEHLLLLISCPFLALSATVENPDTLHKWLQTAQDFQREKEEMLFKSRPKDSYHVNLVIEKYRHSDLEKSMFVPSETSLEEETLDTESLQKIHPCCSLTVRVVKLRGIPDHIVLSPRECYNLFTAMKATWSDKKELDHLSPDAYFVSETFLKKQQVKLYEQSLKEELSSWVQCLDEDQKFLKVLHILCTDMKIQKDKSPLILSGLQFVEESFITLLTTLKEKDMLPILVFCMDRRMCQVLVEKVVAYCENEEQQFRAFNKDKIPTKQKGMKALKKLKKIDKKELNVHDFVSKKEDITEERDVRFRPSKKGKEALQRARNNLTLKSDQLRAMRLPRDRSPVSLSDVYRQEDNDTNFWLDHNQLSGVTFAGIGMIDREDKVIVYLHNRMQGIESSSEHKAFMKGIRYGISYHHSGMSNKYRSTVEMLFRKKFLRIIVCTSTLALGIHVPCRTVVIAGDSPYLTPIMFHQMSGRSGRRGYDMIGNVIFNGVPEQKVRRLISANLPRLLGNFPISVSLCLRLLILVKEVRCNGEKREDAQKDTIARVLTLLHYPLVLHEQPEWTTQFKHHFLYSLQFLMREGLLSVEGIPQGMAGIVAHLHYHEPGNYAFVSCLSSGLFHQLCQAKGARFKDGTFTKELLLKIILVLSYFFARFELHRKQPIAKRSNSLVLLQKLPGPFQRHIQDYNQRVCNIFYMYLHSVATYCDEKLDEDNVLPVSHISFKSIEDFKKPSCGSVEEIVYKDAHKNIFCSSFAGLSSHTDNNLDTQNKLLANIRHQVYTDVDVIPTLDVDLRLNSYAYDFFNHGIKAAIVNENGLKSGAVFEKLKDFTLVLKTISTSFELFAPETDIVAKAFHQLADEYQALFYKAFPDSGH